MSEKQLWTDERIEVFVNAKYDASEYFEVLGAMHIIRDDYQATIDHLRAELAEKQRWCPLPDGVTIIEDGTVGLAASLGGSLLESKMALSDWRRRLAAHYWR